MDKNQPINFILKILVAAILLLGIGIGGYYAVKTISGDNKSSNIEKQLSSLQVQKLEYQNELQELDEKRSNNIELIRKSRENIPSEYREDTMLAIALIKISMTTYSNLTNEIQNLTKYDEYAKLPTEGKMAFQKHFDSARSILLTNDVIEIDIKEIQNKIDAIDLEIAILEAKKGK